MLTADVPVPVGASSDNDDDNNVIVFHSASGHYREVFHHLDAEQSR